MRRDVRECLDFVSCPSWSEALIGTHLPHGCVGSNDDLSTTDSTDSTRRSDHIALENAGRLTFGEIRVKVLFPIELRARCNRAVEGQAQLDGRL